MTPSRFRQIEELYRSARAASAESRTALLAKAEPDLRREVEALLAQDEDRTVTQAIVGKQFGPYRIEGLLGSGGMGEVYRAVDTRLDRKVAVKVSADRFSDRFEREARAIAALNHPRICTLHDVGPNYLVMELLEGETLAARLRRGPLATAEAVHFAMQIASALAAAHARGIVHRDLKPGNIMITGLAGGQDGVKILDFGLAKMDGSVAGPGGDPLTGSHAVMGTPAYMAPEQAAGQPCDARADIYALGLVLDEMLTGKRLELGEKAGVGIPPRLAHVVERCLASDREQRWQSARDLELELGWAWQQAPQPPSPPREGRPMWLRAAVLAVVLVVAAVTVYRSRPPAPNPPAPTVRFRIPVPEGLRLAESGQFSLSPNGRTLVFLAAKSGGALSLWAQSMDSFEARLLSGTELSGGDPPPFWSPDSRFLVFYSGGKLKKTDLTGNTPQTLCATPGILLGGTWTRDGFIIFGRDTGGLMRVPEKGGEPVPLTTVDRTRGERVHGSPALLPDGRHFIYSRIASSPENSGVYVGSLDAQPGEQGLKQLVATRFFSQYVALPNGNGKLLFLRDGTLWAQDLDASRLELVGEPSRVAEQVGGELAGGHFSFSAGDALVYRNASVHAARLTWFDRHGKRLAAVGEPLLEQSAPVLSPDGTRATLSAFDGGNMDLWIYDLARDVKQRLTSDPALELSPVWSPDGKRIAFCSSRAGHYDLYQIAAAGEGPEELLYQSGENKCPTSWSADGRFLIYDTEGRDTGQDIWALPLDGAGRRTPIPIARTRANESAGALSPDGRWLAFESDDSGAHEVYVQPFDAAGGHSSGGPKVLVSKGGGSLPRWRADEKELFYSGPEATLMSVAVKSGAPFQPGIPAPVFDTHVGWWDAAADGNRFLVAVPAEHKAPQPFIVVLNWQTSLKK